MPANIRDKALNSLRRTFIPPLWAVFRRIPGGVRLWLWCLKVLRLSPLHEVAQQVGLRPAIVEGYLPSVRVIDAPRSSVPLCKVGDLPEFADPAWSAVAKELGIITSNLDHVTKKYWEYVHLIYGLKQLHCLTAAMQVLSVGCGFEIPMYYLSNHTAHVYGIDLFDGNLDLQSPLDHPERYVSFLVTPGRITVQRMDGRHLEFADKSFDVVYSLSSIEHFGGNASAAQAMREVGRVLKPGGVAAIATELILNEQPHPFFFSIDDLFRYVIQPSGLSLIGQPDFSISPSLLEAPPRVEAVHRKPFLAVYWGQTLFASVMLFMKKV